MARVQLNAYAKRPTSENLWTVVESKIWRLDAKYRLYTALVVGYFYVRQHVSHDTVASTVYRLWQTMSVTLLIIYRAQFHNQNLFRSLNLSICHSPLAAKLSNTYISIFSNLCYIPTCIPCKICWSANPSVELIYIFRRLISLSWLNCYCLPILFCFCVSPEWEERACTCKYLCGGVEFVDNSTKGRQASSDYSY